MKQPALALFFFLLACAPDTQKPTRFVARRDALSSGVVIAEVYGGGGVATSAYKYDFVELFNRGAVAVDVSNWSVQYAGANSGAWQPTSLGSFGVLQPGQSLLVRMGGSASGAGLDLPAHDVTGASLMSATSGKVALVSSTGGLSGNCPSTTAYVDLVGYGSAATCAEGNSTADTSGITSVSRIGAGCTETDSNANDFTVSGPLPRNASAGNLPCGSTPPLDGGTFDAGTLPIDAGACVLLPSFAIDFQSGGYELMKDTTFGEFSSTNATDVLTLEAFFGAGLTLPASETFNSSSRYANCKVCALLSRGCTMQGCTKDYFAQGGSASVTVATRDERDGRLTGAFSAVRFVEWNFMADQAVAGGECVVLAAQSVNVSWGAGPTGGGGGSAAGGGSGTDAGTGGGTGGGGGGGSAEVDAGTGGGGGKLGGMSGCGCTGGGEGSLAVLLFAMLRRRHGARGPVIQG